jgi:hypothetical protein
VPAFVAFRLPLIPLFDKKDKMMSELYYLQRSNKYEMHDTACCCVHLSPLPHRALSASLYKLDIQGLQALSALLTDEDDDRFPDWLNAQEAQLTCYGISTKMVIDAGLREAQRQGMPLLNYPSRSAESETLPYMHVCMIQPPDGTRTHDSNEQHTTPPLKGVHCTVTLTTEQLSDVLCSALEGGSNSWYTIEEFVDPTLWQFNSEPKREKGHWAQDYPFNPGGALLISDMTDSAHGVMRLDTEAIQKGLAILAEKYPWHLASILAENADADTGDALLQCSLFGDVIYG